MSYDVFISHAHHDKSIADAVCATLEQRGIRCWVAPRDILPGADWGRSIIDAIKSCRAIVLVFSAAANTSPQVLREVERAIHQGMPVLPIRIEDVMPEGALEYHLGTVHWLDAMSPPLEAHLHRLADVLLAILGREKRDSPVAAAPPAVEPPAAPAPPPPSPAPAARRGFRTPARALIVVAVLVALGIGGALLQWVAAPKDLKPVLVRTLTGAEAGILCIAFSPDHRLIAGGGYDNTVHVWDVDTGLELYSYPGDSYIDDVAISPDGRLLAAGDLSGQVRLWNLSTQEPVPTIAREEQSVESLAFSPNSRRLATGGNKQDYRPAMNVWDVITNGHDYRVEPVEPGGAVGAITYSPDGKWIAGGNGSGYVWVWDADSGNQVQALRAGGDVGGLAFSPDNRLLAVGHYDASVDLFDTSTWQKINSLNGQASYIHDVAFSPDGRWLIDAAHDHVAQIWEVATGRLANTLAEDDIVFDVAFSADGKYIATAGDSHNIKIWSTQQ